MCIRDSRNVMQTNVELSKNNFQVIGTAQGSATVIRVFGIGAVIEAVGKDVPDSLKPGMSVTAVSYTHLRGTLSLFPL